MNIADVREKCKTAVVSVPRDVLIIGILIGTCLASFGLGYFAGKDAGQALGGQGSSTSLETRTTPLNTPGEVVASKAGTKYYLPTCAGADRISDDNKVWFASADLARAQGYEPASNCNGI